MVAGAAIPATTARILRLPHAAAPDGGRTLIGSRAQPSPRRLMRGGHTAPGCVVIRPTVTAARPRARFRRWWLSCGTPPPRPKSPSSDGWMTWPTWSLPLNGSWPPMAGPRLLVPHVPPLPSPRLRGGGPVGRPWPRGDQQPRCRQGPREAEGTTTISTGSRTLGSTSSAVGTSTVLPAWGKAPPRPECPPPQTPRARRPAPHTPSGGAVCKAFVASLRNV